MKSDAENAQSASHDEGITTTQPEKSLDEKVPPQEMKLGTVYIGTIGNKYPISLNLIEESGKVSGAYYYDKVGTDIKLEGEKDEEGMKLREFDAEGETTGRWELENEMAEGYLNGSWKKSSTAKELSIHLQEVDKRIWHNTVQSPWAGSWTDGYGSLDIRMISKELAYFSHFATNGRNIGEISGQLLLEKDQSIYEMQEEGFEEICKIRYELKGDTLISEHLSRYNCGAGNGVYFSGKLVKQAAFEAHYNALPLAKKIGENRLWLCFGNERQDELHLGTNGQFSWIVSGKSGDHEMQGEWQTQGTDELILVMEPNAKVSTWKVSQLSSFSMRLSIGNDVYDFEMRGYY